MQSRATAAAESARGPGSATRSTRARHGPPRRRARGASMEEAARRRRRRRRHRPRPGAGRAAPPARPRPAYSALSRPTAFARARHHQTVERTREIAPRVAVVPGARRERSSTCAVLLLVLLFPPTPAAKALANERQIPRRERRDAVRRRF